MSYVSSSSSSSSSLSKWTWVVLFMMDMCWLSHAFMMDSRPSGRIHILMSSSSSDAPPNKQPKKKKKKAYVTLRELSEQVQANPAKYLHKDQQQQQQATKKKRTRQRVDQPQQSYVYAAQKQKNNPKNNIATSSNETSPESTTTSANFLWKDLPLAPLATLHASAVPYQTPRLIRTLHVGNATLYVVDKPAGWALVGTKSPASRRLEEDEINEQSPSSSQPSTTKKTSKPAPPKQTNTKRRVQVVDEEDGSVDVLEYTEQAVFDSMTREELEEFLLDGGEIPPGVVIQPPGQHKKQQQTPSIQTSSPSSSSAVTTPALLTEPNPDWDASTLEHWKRIRARTSNTSRRASFAHSSRPAVVPWLKEHLQDIYQVTIRGGNAWKAVAGATGVDDSGLVLLCPKKWNLQNNLFGDSMEYVAVAGNPHQAVVPTNHGKNREAPVTIHPLAKLKKGRGEDIVETLLVTIPEQFSSCQDVIPWVQGEYQTGVRGDPSAHPLERAAPRRLIHCQRFQLSSLVEDEVYDIDLSTSRLPDDIAQLADRRNHLEYTQGSFLGRSKLQGATDTNAYRELNGAADGYPGWTVDRYRQWLWVQHDPAHPTGPLPSLHDGHTMGVYYLPVHPDRSAMGMQTTTTTTNRPRLLEGQPAPDPLTIRENGINYLVSLEKDLSTGLFLDQRPQRQWLAQHCGPDTHVLNCFAHTGAFSVAAATAGASTTSLDLSSKWLDRLPQHFEANGLDFDERHDKIFGDVFEWLPRLAKRGELYDVVILDPPSASVGGRKKRRWSVQKDLAELVALAAPLVKPQGGVLWTTTNHAGFSATKFARACHKGLQQAIEEGVVEKDVTIKLERIQPMPVDFSTVGPNNVKNLVWRFGSLS